MTRAFLEAFIEHHTAVIHCPKSGLCINCLLWCKRKFCAEVSNETYNQWLLEWEHFSGDFEAPISGVEVYRSDLPKYTNVQLELRIKFARYLLERLDGLHT